MPLLEIGSAAAIVTAVLGERMHEVAGRSQYPRGGERIFALECAVEGVDEQHRHLVPAGGGLERCLRRSTKSGARSTTRQNVSERQRGSERFADRPSSRSLSHFAPGRLSRRFASHGDAAQEGGVVRKSARSCDP